MADDSSFNQAFIEHSFNLPYRAMLQEPSNIAPANTDTMALTPLVDIKQSAGSYYSDPLCQV